MEDFNIMYKIGEGTYGVVFKAENKKTGEYVAVKKIKLYNDRRDVPETAMREISTLKKLNHPNVVKLDHVFLAEKLYLVFEFLFMDLKVYLDTLGSIKFMSPSVVKSYLFQINSAIMYCHQNCTIHRNLKPQNLLINTTGVIKVAGFSLARAYNLPIKMYTPGVVTLWYRAPELLLGSQIYACSIDMWSVGCIFAEMTTNKPLFPGDSQIDQLFRIFRILRTPTNDIWPGVTGFRDFKAVFPKWNRFTLPWHVNYLDDMGVDLLVKMLTYDPARRISAKQSIRHAYFKDVMLPPGLPLPMGH